MKVGKIGMELEYILLDNNYNVINDSEYQEYLINEYNLHREFYKFMIELNNYLKQFNLNEIYNVLSEIKTYVICKANEISKNEGVVVALSEFPFLAYNSLIFNGFHLHLSINRKNFLLKLPPLWRILYKIIDFKLKFCDLRFLTSYHIWGYVRNSDYNFKRNARYKLLNITNFSLEFRAFSFWDIFFNKARYQLSKLLINIIQAMRGYKKLLFKKEKYQKIKEAYERLKYSYSSENFIDVIYYFINELIYSKYPMQLYRYDGDKLFYKVLISKQGKLDILEDYVDLENNNTHLEIN